MFTCPVRLFTPDLMALWRWFDRLYTVDLSGLVPQYRRQALPQAGGLGQQPARLLDELAWLASCRNAALVTQTQRRRTRRKRS